ncbi:hypothetical protein [Vibrio vulnificus]|uniref:hypothetical protein n=1 Tax=Vibrio vulnificus TaxID=672 RepID=UPI0028782CA6|nr:hypothetical protein [Vibrio vulnificus]MDS1872844.1 hypothetical protein [Vibrio vulnificus]
MAINKPSTSNDVSNICYLLSQKIKMKMDEICPYMGDESCVENRTTNNEACIPYGKGYSNSSRLIERLESDAGQLPFESATLGLSQLKLKNRAIVGNQMRRNHWIIVIAPLFIGPSSVCV